MNRPTRPRAPIKSGVREDPASAYDMTPSAEGIEQRTLACIVDNEPGVLARVVGLFSARGYNIESLTVAEIDRNAHQSRITIVTSGTGMIIAELAGYAGSNRFGIYDIANPNSRLELFSGSDSTGAVKAQTMLSHVRPDCTAKLLVT